MQPILQHLFQVSDLEDVSRERLESFVEEHPSFGIAHFLLSRKLQAEDSSRFEEETQRTCLYFSNPFWLQWLLENREGKVKVAEPLTAMSGGEALIPEAPAAQETAMEWKATEEPAPIEQAAEGSDWENVVTVAEDAYSETQPGDDLAEALSGAEPETATASEATAAEQLLRSIEEARELRETLHKMNDDLAVETAMAGESLEEPVPAAIEHTERITEYEPAAVEPTEPATEHEPAAAALTADSPARQEPAPATSQDILFEPYHTIDYFASQGIKLTLDENPADTLGKQLKSFTDWLKSMRRLPQKDREVIPDRVAEEAVQSIAAHSIEGREVVTETMAEVLVKQGMREKARAVYEKLSLLNPDKRVYFAAKIEQLNIP